MIRSRRLLLLLFLALAWPAFAEQKLTLHALGAEISAGTGSIVSLGNSRHVLVFARVTAGSGTVTTFDVWIECSENGTDFTECALDDRVEGTTTGAGPHTDDTIKLIAETAVTTSAVYSARISSPPQTIRARWNIAGTTPSETFEVIAVLR